MYEGKGFRTGPLVAGAVLLTIALFTPFAEYPRTFAASLTAGAFLVGLAKGLGRRRP